MIRMIPVFNLCSSSGFNGIGLVTKSPEVDFSPVHAYLHSPLIATFIPINTHATRCVTAKDGFISAIVHSCSFAKINPSIIATIVVDVVSGVFWKYAIHVKKCKPAGSVCFAINHDMYVTVSNGASDTSNSNATHYLRPHKQASIRVVTQKFFESVLGYTISGNFHTSIMNLIGSVCFNRRDTIILHYAKSDYPRWCDA